VTSKDPPRYHDPADRSFLGHPKGLGYLSFSEAWERFSYYGMSALLGLYGARYLFQPEHIGRIWGFAHFRAILEASLGPLTPLTLGGAIAGLYGGFTYLMPIFGGLIGDRSLGPHRAVVLGAIIMAIGHFAMAFDQTYLLALACILVGVGLFKGNLTAQIGGLYDEDDVRRADAFQIYVFGIQIAVIAAPIICGTLGQKAGWHYGFSAAGVGMLIGLAVYLRGRRWLPATPRADVGTFAQQDLLLTSTDRKRLIVLFALLPVLALAVVANMQIYGAYTLWGDAHFQLMIFGWDMPSTWLLSMDGFMAALTLGGSVAFWRWWGKRHRQPDELSKMIIGTFIAALAPLVLALGAARESVSGEKLALGWAIAFHFLNNVGMANLTAVGMALYSRIAPKALSATMLSTFILIYFISSIIAAKLATLLDIISGTEFWSVHAAMVGGAGLILLCFRTFSGQLLIPTEVHL
jgi:POT family proton-dependent oligopeptide transporter